MPGATLLLAGVGRAVTDGLSYPVWGGPQAAPSPHSTLDSSLLAPGGPSAGNKVSWGCWRRKGCSLSLAADELWSAKEDSPAAPAPADEEIIHQRQGRAFLEALRHVLASAWYNTNQTVIQFRFKAPAKDMGRLLYLCFL